MNKYFCRMQATRLMIDNEITGTTSFDELWARKYFTGICRNQFSQDCQLQLTTETFFYLFSRQVESDELAEPVYHPICLYQVNKVVKSATFSFYQPNRFSMKEKHCLKRFTASFGNQILILPRTDSANCCQNLSTERMFLFYFHV